MKQKIEWYKEVLELEPGSRVFFPLAKLLADDGDPIEAITTLKQGLLRHPDHVEARLLLVELLFTHGDAQQVYAEIDGLAELFSSYPGFWAAWCEKLSATPALHDAALALRFFSAALQGKNVSWTAIIQHGLHSILGGEHGLSETDAVRDPVLAASSAVAEEIVARVTADSGKTSEQRDVSIQDAKSLEEVPDVSSTDYEDEDEALEEEVEEDAGPLTEYDQPQTSASDLHDHMEKMAAYEQGQAVTDSALPRAAATLAAVEHEPEHDENEEAFSLRTRSMAEVLAEQGDVTGALDIYNELMHNAASDEKPSLEARIEELSHRIGISPVMDTPDPDKAQSGESTRLVSLLESLAQRLEERAR